MFEAVVTMGVSFLSNVPVRISASLSLGLWPSPPLLSASARPDLIPILETFNMDKYCLLPCIENFSCVREEGWLEP